MTLDLEAIRKREQAATPGPWQRSGIRKKISDVDCIVVGPNSAPHILFPIGVRGEFQADAIKDAEFIAHAREDIPALLAEIARLEGERDETRRYVRVLGRRQCTALIEDPEGQKHGCHYLVRAEETEAALAAAKAMRLKLDKRIHNQRKAAGITWEIVEMRRKWLGSATARLSCLRRERLAKERATTAESAPAACREENERLREGCRLYDLALKEAEAILGGEYDLHHGPLFNMAEAARALVEGGDEGGHPHQHRKDRANGQS